MLILKSFRIGAAIIAYFNLKIKQFNVINAFINTVCSSELLLVICKLLLGFKKLGYVIKVNRALYSLYDFLIL
jgi:hypothetical protein